MRLRIIIGSALNFALSGSGYSPNSTVRRFIHQPSWEGFREISSITANGVGQMSFSYTPTCADAVGTTYIYVVDGPTGRQSPTVSEQVAAHTSCVPAITGISPSTPAPGPGNQSIAVTGSAFQNGQTVTVTFPGGGSTTLSGSQVVFDSSISITLAMTLADPGTYRLRVNSPNLTQSGLFSFTAQASSGVIVGRIVKDLNGDGEKQADEPFLQSPGVSCGGEAVGGLTITWSGPASGSAGPVQCFDGQPSYHSGTVPAGTYSMGISVPSGWQVIRSTAPTVSIPGNTADPWFYVRPPAQTGFIAGRIVKDVNGDGEKQANEPFLQGPGITCGGEALAGLTVTWSGSTSGSIAPVQCFDGQPSYHSGTLAAGTYSMAISVPSGWQVRSVRS